MSDEAKWAIIIVGITVIAIIAIIIVSSILEALQERLFIYGMLAGVPIGVLITSGIQRVIRWRRTHRIVRIEEDE